MLTLNLDQVKSITETANLLQADNPADLTDEEKQLLVSAAKEAELSVRMFVAMVAKVKTGTSFNLRVRNGFDVKEQLKSNGFEFDQDLDGGYWQASIVDVDVNNLPDVTYEVKD